MEDSSTKCSVTRAHVLALIKAIVHTLGSDEYRPVADDDHYRGLVSQQVEALLCMAEEIGLDVWSETAAPVGCDDTPIAVLLREADARFGEPRGCPVPGCSHDPVLCGRRPRSLPAGTRWPSCPELCGPHTAVRYAVLVRRVQQRRPQHEGPIHAALMPLPEVADLSPTPEELRGLETN